MNLKISSNIFLGSAELEYFKKSLQEEGYKALVKQVITSYGVVRNPLEEGFTSLKPIMSGSGQVTIKSGVAIDTNLNIIKVGNDQIDALTVPSDGIKRFVTIKYRKTILEEGTVNVQADGTITGTGTKFTETLRGQGNFPAKVIFYTPNNSTADITSVEGTEYEIQAVQNDTLASINAAQGTIQTGTNLKYVVVGSFTPGIAVPKEDKFPFQSDGYVIRLKMSEKLEANEYLLASVTFNGTTTQVEDRRQDNLFSTWDADLRKISAKNPVIGVESIKFDSGISDGSKNYARVGWGLTSPNGNWSANALEQSITVNQLSGGVVKSIQQLVSSNISANSFEGWRIVFQGTGQVQKIKKSSYINGNLVLNIDYNSSYPTEGDVLLVPDSNFTQIKVSSSDNPTADRELTYATKQGFALVDLEAGVTSNLKFRQFKGDQSTELALINDGSYINEKSFSASGNLLATKSTTQCTQGNVATLINRAHNANLLDRVVTPGFIIDFFGTSTEAESQVGFVICDGRTINKPGSRFHGQKTPDLRGRTTVGADNESTDYRSGSVGGSDKIKLTEAQMPPHNHDVEKFEIDPHSHELRVRAGVMFDNKEENPGGAGRGERKTMDGHMDSEAKTEETTLTGNIKLSSAGKGEEIDIRQKYMALYKLMKV